MTWAKVNTQKSWYLSGVKGCLLRGATDFHRNCCVRIILHLATNHRSFPSLALGSRLDCPVNNLLIHSMTEMHGKISEGKAVVWSAASTPDGDILGSLGYPPAFPSLSSLVSACHSISFLEAEVDHHPQSPVLCTQLTQGAHSSWAFKAAAPGCFSASPGHYLLLY